MDGDRIDGRRLATTIFVAVTSNSVLSASRFAVPVVALGFGASDFTVGVLSALLMIVPLVTTVPYGRWMDRVGALKPMKIATALAILAGLVSVVQPGLVSLALTSALAGAGAMLCHVASIKAVGGAGDRNTRVRTLGLLAMAYSVMQFVSPLVIGYAYDHSGPRAAFLALSTTPLLGMVVLLVGRHFYVPTVSHASEPVAPGGRLGLLADARLRGWALIYAVFQAGLGLYPIVLAMHGSKLGMSGAVISGLFAAQAVGQIASRGTISLIQSAVSRRLLVSTALVVSAAAYAITPLLQDWSLLAAVSVCVGAATGLGQPVSMAMVYETAPPRRVNEAISMASISANALQLVAPFVSGALASLYGIATMTSILALSLIAAAFVGARHAGR
ncbi:MFS transporter [uncultured Alsobacter sp.]|uniref:MFS transporter n=1 Tax=uncultured Alsobacter sp. TaxID=1748258 RepID=UPI0025DF0811|nr:MFS transporter [uncultured Alsobacter sp.]